MNVKRHAVLLFVLLFGAQLFAGNVNTSGISNGAAAFNPYHFLPNSSPSLNAAAKQIDCTTAAFAPVNLFQTTTSQLPTSQNTTAQPTAGQVLSSIPSAPPSLGGDSDKNSSKDLSSALDNISKSLQDIQKIITVGLSTINPDVERALNALGALPGGSIPAVNLPTANLPQAIPPAIPQVIPQQATMPPQSIPQVTPPVIPQVTSQATSLINQAKPIPDVFKIPAMITIDTSVFPLEMLLKNGLSNLKPEVPEGIPAVLPAITPATNNIDQDLRTPPYILSLLEEIKTLQEKAGPLLRGL